MKTIRTKLIRPLAILLSMVMLLTGLPLPVYAESVSTPADIATENLIEAVEPPVNDPTTEADKTRPEEMPPQEDITEEFPPDEAEEETVEVELSVKAMLAAQGYAYLMTDHDTQAYSAPDLEQCVFIIAPGGILLMTACAEQENRDVLEARFLTAEGEAMTAYVDANDLPDLPMDSADVEAAVNTTAFALVFVGDGKAAVFAVEGTVPGAEEAPPMEETPSIPESPTDQTAEEPTAEPQPPVEQFPEEPIPENTPAADEWPDDLPAETELPAEEPIPEEAPQMPDQTEEPAVSPDQPVALPKEAPAVDTELPAQEPLVQAGDFVLVTMDTRAFLGVDDSASEAEPGALCLGTFVNDAAVQVEAIFQDNLGRDWYKVCYLYGDDYADGTLKWTEYDTIYVLADETFLTDAQELDVTDYAFGRAPRAFALRASASFGLRDISVSLGSFYAGQSELYGDSGRDSEYLQIATKPGHGKIYATPHYLEGFTVYCLEHNLPGPGERVSGGGYQPKGPYIAVDMASYMNAPGYSGVVYHESTLHAIAWVLRHTVPFMELDRSDADNRTWSRVAGQFAIREVIKQLEGAQYVRDYWQMEDFYAASGNAPAVYLEYARWLAANGIARASMTGQITVSGKQTTAANGQTIGMATLTTDADLIRVSKSCGSMTGHTAGEDNAYYYLHSGDTVTVTSAVSPFSITAESVSSPEEEASFLVGVPDAAIQKVLIPQSGAPYALRAVEITFESPRGDIAVTKTDALDGTPLEGVQFDVYRETVNTKNLVTTITTDDQGAARTIGLPEGNYVVKERMPQVGYVANAVEWRAAVRAGETTRLSVTNQPIQGRIQIRKTDALTGEALAGAEFTVTRLSGLYSHEGSNDGEIVAVLTTDENGLALTPLLTWGTYRVEETKVPAHYADNRFSAVVTISENEQTVIVDAANEPAKGWIRLVKTDRENGNPIAGVVFDVDYNDPYGQGLAATMVTDENGVAISEPLRKGRYIVTERGETAGYVFEPIELNATVHSDETTELAAPNQPVMTRLKLYKRDADEYAGDPAAVPGTRGDGVLTGAEFQVLAAEDILDRQGLIVHEKGDVIVASLKTGGEDASVTTDMLWPGLYEIVERTPPAGYQGSDSPVIVDTRDAAHQSGEAVIAYEGVVANKIKVGAQAMVKLLGDGTAEADPTRVETPEPGAEFHVYLQKAGSYENAREFERDTLTTDRNGYAMTKPLPYGVYVLEQIKGREGYEIKGPILFEIDGTESLVNPPVLTLSDQPILYRLTFVKTDSQTGRVITLSNTTFKLKDMNGEYIRQKVYYPREQVIDMFTTDESGSVTLPEAVTWGLYYIEEAISPEGYLIQSEDVPVFVGSEGDKPGQTYEMEIEIPNDPVKGRILLDKKGLRLTGFETGIDPYGHEVHTPVYEERYLAGAVFEVRAAEDIIGRDGTVWYQAGELADTITTTENGGDASMPLPLGKYHLIETAAPEGYSFDSAPLLVELCAEDDTTPLAEVRVAVRNDYLPTEITLFKEKEAIRIVSGGKDGVQSILTNEPGEGFVFGLFSARDIPYADGALMADTLVASGVTDKNGMLRLTGMFPHGDYSIRELYAPEGWTMSAERIDLSITPNRKAEDENVLRVLITEPIHNALIHAKVTLTKTDITGETLLPGATIEVYNEAGEVICRDTTDENGKIAAIPVVPGRYTFREVCAPEGYALNEAVMSFTVDTDGSITGDTVIRDEYARFAIQKRDENELPLAGVEFSLIAEDGTVAMTARTDREGMAVFEKVLFGHYHVAETSPLAGYLPAEIDVEITVDGTFVNPVEPVAVIVNVPNEVLVRKVDQEGKPLAGAAFGLFDAFGERFAASVSDENGMARFTRVPYGSYTIREIKAPEGYLTSRQEIPVTMDADHQSTGKPAATVVNRLKRVRFIKQDTSGKRLSGVEFALVSAVTQEVVENAVSNEMGEFAFTRFDYGDWLVRETKAPEGYNRMEDVLLHVDESWMEPDPIVLVDIPSTYMFYKSDNRRRPLAGAVFAVEDENGHVVREAVSAENGVVTIDGLTPGRYVIRETEAPEGFTVSDDTIEVVIDEKYTVLAKLKRFVNYPSISTGVDISPTILTWIGLGLAGIAGAILALGVRKRKRNR